MVVTNVCCCILLFNKYRRSERPCGHSCLYFVYHHILFLDQNFIHGIIKHDGWHAYTTGVFYCLNHNVYAPHALLMYCVCTYLSARIVSGHVQCICVSWVTILSLFLELHGCLFVFFCNCSDCLYLFSDFHIIISLLPCCFNSYILYLLWLMFYGLSLNTRSKDLNISFILFLICLCAIF